MAAPKVRRWRVEPDEALVTQQGEIACVSREAMIRAIMDGEAVLAVMGGILEVRTRRQRTDLPGEAVTVAAVVAWYDSDAARDGEAVARSAPFEEVVGEEPVEEVTGEVEPLDDAEGGEPDGLDPSTLEEEDVSSIPEHVR